MVASDTVGRDGRLLPDVALAETREQVAATGEILSVLAAASSSQEEVFEAVPPPRPRRGPQPGSLLRRAPVPTAVG